MVSIRKPGAVALAMVATLGQGAFAEERSLQAMRRHCRLSRVRRFLTQVSNEPTKRISHGPCIPGISRLDKAANK
jgi:hypothetical protein